MARWIYSNNGFDWQGAWDDQIAEPGQVIFDHFPASEEELQEAFPLRLSVIIAQAKAAKYADLTAIAQAGITGSFTSSALGSAHTYPSLSTDQSNLHTGLLSVPADPTGWTWKLWCADGAAWDFVEHTAAELKQVITDYGISLQGFQLHWAGVVTLLNAAATLEDIANVNW